MSALGNTDMLRKCLERYTHNMNESLNSVVWKLCPKHKKHGLTVVQAAVTVAISIFNDGAKSLILVMESPKTEHDCPSGGTKMVMHAKIHPHGVLAGGDSLRAMKKKGNGRNGSACLEIHAKLL